MKLEFSMRRTLPVGGALILLCGPTVGAPLLPNFSAATFINGAPIDNPYFSLINNRVTRFEGATVDEDGDPIIEAFEMQTLGAGPSILGVATATLRDRAFKDGLLTEDTLDYYAQDTAGNVWYFGEDVTNYVYDDNDVLIGTNFASSWRAGVNDALPGFIMPADITLGFNYYQESAPLDGALDQARIQGHLDRITVDFGTFFDVLQIWEGTELDPSANGFKYYARGFGLILEDEHLDAQLRNPEFSVGLSQVSSVPLPPALPLLGAALLSVFGTRRRIL